MSISLDYQVVWNKYITSKDKAVDWLLKSGRASGIDKTICLDFYKKYNLEALEHIRICVDLIKKGKWYVRV